MTQEEHHAGSGTGPASKPPSKPPGNLAMQLGFSLGFALLIAGVGYIFGAPTLLLEALGMSETTAQAVAIPFNVVFVFVLSFAAGFGPKVWRFTAQALCGGVFGLHVGQAMATGGGRPEFAMEPDAAFAMLVGFMMLILGLVITAGLLSRKVGDAMQLEKAGQDRAMLIPSAITTVAEGGLLMGLAAISVLSSQTVGLWIAACAVLIFLGISAWGNLEAWRKSDELYRQFWNQSVHVAVNLVLAMGVLWLIAQSFGLVPEASLLGMLAVFWAVYVLSSVVLMKRLYPWMLEKASAQTGAEAS
jgi:hypothetical protein